MGLSTIQPRFGEDHYPIGGFILHRARVLGLSRNDLVHRLGYRDIGSGQEALNAVLRGVVAPHAADYLADALEADKAVVESVIDATIRQKRDEARLNHRLWKLQDVIRGQKRRLRVESERPYLTSSDRTCTCKQSAQCPHRFSWRQFRGRILLGRSQRL
jgi:hypothetical protein